MNAEYRRYWQGAHEWDAWLEEEVEEHRELWRGIWRKARVPDESRRRAAGLPGEWKLLVLAEDWCGDASNTVPVLARLAEEAPGLEMRVLERDRNPELMDRWLTDGSRSIPLAIVLDDEFEPVGRWGPRPRELQAFVLREKRKGDRESAEIYRDTRRWYARDGGRTTLREVLDALEAAAAGAPAGTGRS